MSEWKCVSHKRIDAARWDACIECQDGEVFSEAWYWNAVCKTWKGWIKGDYEAVIPWPIKQKFLVIPILKTPLYVKWIDGDEGQITHALKQFRGIKRIHLPFPQPRALEKVVQVLNLDYSWKPSQELARNLRKAEKSNPEWVESVGWEEFCLCMQMHHPYPWPNFQQQTMQHLYEAARASGRGGICGVRINNEWAAMQFYIFHRSKAYFIQNVVVSSWRNSEPMSFLINRLFSEWQQSNEHVKVNFMGSANPGVARFNQKFGANSLLFWDFSR
jgi:hypothetical protein